MRQISDQERESARKATEALNGIMQKFLVDLAPNMLKFDDLRWHYYSVQVGRRTWKYCWSLTRNQNGKFISWVYKPVGSGRKAHWVHTRIKEFARRCKAEARSVKLRISHQKRLNKSKERRATTNI